MRQKISNKIGEHFVASFIVDGISIHAYSPDPAQDTKALQMLIKRWQKIEENSTRLGVWLPWCMPRQHVDWGSSHH